VSMFVQSHLLVSVSCQCHWFKWYIRECFCKFDKFKYYNDKVWHIQKEKDNKGVDKIPWRRTRRKEKQKKGDEAEKKQESENRERQGHGKVKNMICNVAAQHLYEGPNNLSHRQQRKRPKQPPYFTADGFTEAAGKLRDAFRGDELFNAASTACARVAVRLRGFCCFIRITIELLNLFLECKFVLEFAWIGQ